jgi:hypothetical protein
MGEFDGEANPMEGEIKEDRNPGGANGVNSTRSPRLDGGRTVLKTFRYGEIFFNRF